MAIPSAEAPKKRRKAIPGFAQLQRVGRSLMLPIAVLPAAALLQRFVRCRTAHSPVQRQLPLLGQIGIGLKAPQSRSAVLPAPACQNRTRLHPDPVQNPRPGDQQIGRAHV